MFSLKRSVALLLTGAAALADSPAMPTPRVTVSRNAEFIFKQVPARWNNEGVVTNEHVGIAYQLETDGTFRRLWRVEGWYAFQTFLSNDGHYLVRMGNWSGGQNPSREDLAVAFYDKGKLLAEYSTADLVKDHSKVSRSVSHYTWLAHDVQIFRPNYENEKPEPLPELGWDNKFHLKTCDGISYAFDATTGKIISAKRDGVLLLPLPSAPEPKK